MYNLPPLAPGDRKNGPLAPGSGSDESPRVDRWTLLDVLRWTTRRFEERKVPSARLDAEVLIAAALHIKRVQLYVQFDRPLAPEELATIRDFVRRRQNGECVAYITGRKEFFGLEFAVDPRVLVPRPDTETLVDESLARLREREGKREGEGERERERERERRQLSGDPVGDDAGAADVATDPANDARPPVANTSLAAPTPNAAPAPSATSTETAASAPAITTAPALAPAPPRIAEVGTGSGAILVTLAKHVPGAALFGVDISAEALVVAEGNAATHGVSATWLRGDLAEPLREHAPFDLIVANLPYVPSADIPALSREVCGEPLLALDGGADGLALVRRLIAGASALLTPDGCLALEIGAGQAGATVGLLRAAAFTDVRTRRDLDTVERVVSARRAPASSSGAAVPAA